MVKTNYTVTRFDVGYQGFYVEVTPTLFGGREMIEFTLCNEEYGMKSVMVGFMKEDCPESEWEQIIMGELLNNGHISLYWDDIEAMEDAHDDVFKDGVSDDDDEDECECCGKCDTVLEAIDYHNEHVEDMQDLAEALLKQYPNIENTEVNDVFCKAFNSKNALAILLCCEMNSMDEEHGWMVTEDGYVMHKDECECDGDCENCQMEE